MVSTSKESSALLFTIKTFKNYKLSCTTSNCDPTQSYGSRLKHMNLNYLRISPDKFYLFWPNSLFLEENIQRLFPSYFNTIIWFPIETLLYPQVFITEKNLNENTWGCFHTVLKLWIKGWRSLNIFLCIRFLFQISFIAPPYSKDHSLRK